MIDLASCRRKLDRLIAERSLAERQAADEKRALAEAAAAYADTEAARALVQDLAEAVQSKAHARIASVVSRCLEAVFGEDEAYRFKIDFAKARGKTEARLAFVRGGHELEPADAAGGGVLDLAAFSLRLACLAMARPKRRPFLALDEPFKMLSAEYVPAVRSLLETLAKEMGLSILLVTHNPGLQVGKVIELE